jgi:hypothetical protein
MHCCQQWVLIICITLHLYQLLLSIVLCQIRSLNLPICPLFICRFDGISNLLKAQSGLHGSAGPRGQRPATKGLYMYGGVGCGKTMLMDLLVASAPREFQVRDNIVILCICDKFKTTCGCQGAWAGRLLRGQCGPHCVGPFASTSCWTR